MIVILEGINKINNVKVETILNPRREMTYFIFPTKNAEKRFWLERSISHIINLTSNNSIFKLFSSKTTNDFSFIGTDIHSHLIPNIDDGCANIENSIICIEYLKGMEFNKIVTTPNVMASVYHNTPAEINQGLKLLQTALKDRNIEVEIEAAAEYKVDELFIEYLKEDNLLTFGNNYVLIALSFIAPPTNLEEIIFTMRTKGYKPILAHPERYRYWSNKLHIFEYLKPLNAYFNLI